MSAQPHGQKVTESPTPRRQVREAGLRSEIVGGIPGPRGLSDPRARTAKPTPAPMPAPTGIVTAPHWAKHAPQKPPPSLLP